MKKHVQAAVIGGGVVGDVFGDGGDGVVGDGVGGVGIVGVGTWRWQIL